MADSKPESANSGENSDDKANPIAGHGAMAALIAVAIFVADQANKWWLLNVMMIEELRRIAALPFFDIVFVKNRGVSYGFLRLDSDQGQILLAGFAVLVSLIFAIWMFRTKSRLLAIGLACVIGGALANALDRVLLGGVADFYLLHGFGFEWYVFNLADVAIVAGAAILLYDSFAPNRTSAANAG